MVELFDWNVPKVSSFHRCVCNEWHSIMYRHCKPMGVCSEWFKGQTDEIGNRLMVGLRPMTEEAVIESRPQRMRKRYRNAGVLRGSAALGRAFIKWEKHPYDDDTIPRLIQYRSSAYTLQLARYIIPLERKLAVHCPVDNYGFPFLVKGMNARARADLLRSMFDARKGTNIYLVDHSKFDSMVNKDLLDLSHRVYSGCFGDDALLTHLLRQKYRNVFYTQSGIKYMFDSRRCSGDADTSCGNSIINYVILRIMFPDAIIVVDGDDSVVFSGPTFHNRFEEAGMVTRFSIVSHFQDIEFCQSRPVMTPEGWIMCRNPMRALSRMNIKLGVPDRGFFHTVGIGEGLVSSYMPILSFAAARFRREGVGAKYAVHHLEYNTRVLMWTDRFSYPTDDVRVSFFRAFGITPDVQRDIEYMIGGSVATWNVQ